MLNIRRLKYDFSRILNWLIRPLNFTQNHMCATKTRALISRKILTWVSGLPILSFPFSPETPDTQARKICYIKSGLQIIYAVEQFSSLFSKEKLKARGTHTPTHDPPSHMCCVELALCTLCSALADFPRTKQLSVATTSSVIWLCAYLGWCMCGPSLHYFQGNFTFSIYFS